MQLEIQLEMQPEMQPVGYAENTKRSKKSQALGITLEDEGSRIAPLRYVMGSAWSDHTSESNHSST
jgi:hypothetical protein